MGIGRLAIALILMCILAFAMVSAFSIISHDKSTDDYYNQSNTVNTSIALSTTLNATSTNLVIPLVLISAILLFAGFIIFLRKAR